MYPDLPKSYKGVYPFRLGTTSFIYPDNYIPNVKMLGPYIDEIELLFLESGAKESLPSKHEIDELSRLSREFEITYNVHLPVDIFMGDNNFLTRNYAVETVKKVMDLCEPLAPSTYTLHLSIDEKTAKTGCLDEWQKLLYKGMEKLISAGIKSEAVSIENLNYSIDWVERIIDDFNLSVCIDIGHLILYGFDLETVFNKYLDKTTIIHLHGVENGRDHISLDRISEDFIPPLMGILKRFTGVVSLEVFSYNHLDLSLKFLEKCWQREMGKMGSLPIHKGYELP
ncbi:MAG TPA: sugar phosphate isomerase/epimerase [Desulfobacteraceae bacterium]|nr:sugar phosphate isomerase/epimerase [Desulfobacteraceae bacterium]